MLGKVTDVLASTEAMLINGDFLLHLNHISKYARTNKWNAVD